MGSPVEVAHDFRAQEGLAPCRQAHQDDDELLFGRDALLLLVGLGHSQACLLPEPRHSVSFMPGCIKA